MSDFFSIYSHGLARIAVCSPPVATARPQENARRIVELVGELAGNGVAVAAFGQLSLTGATIGDLTTQHSLIRETLNAIEKLREASTELMPIIIVGAPLMKNNRLYNCAVAIHRGNVLGVVPKSYPSANPVFTCGAKEQGGSIALPGVRAFPEFPLLSAPTPPDFIEDEDGEEINEIADSFFNFADYSAPDIQFPFGTDLIFETKDAPRLKIALEIDDDRTAPIPPASRAALAGANIIINLSSTPATASSTPTIAASVTALSQQFSCAYAYASTGEGESSTDSTMSGLTLIAENGTLLAASPTLPHGSATTISDVDIDIVESTRLKNPIFESVRTHNSIDTDESYSDHNALSQYRRIICRLDAPANVNFDLWRPMNRFPFMPENPYDIPQACADAYSIQVRALRTRLESIGQPKIIIGVSGGLDSTQALLVAALTMDELGRPRSDIHAYTMPGFATSSSTRSHATLLAQALGCTFEEIDIRPAARLMLADMKHPYARGEDVYDVAFENVQAGLRADYLFRFANFHNGIVLGTGDLSETALGWCTYGVGDHMSHYNVNSGLPKTFMQFLIRHTISQGTFSKEINEVLQAILDTEISPELIPARDGEEMQSTQSTVGPYELHDFFLVHMLRYGLKPSKIAFYAWHAWHDNQRGTWPDTLPETSRHAYSLSEIKKWESEFYRRFFISQFKRSTSVDGPLIVDGVSLSPRGGWAMPSDTSGEIWRTDIETIPTELN